MLRGVLSTSFDFTIVLFEAPGRVRGGPDVVKPRSFFSCFGETRLLALNDVDPPHGRCSFYRLSGLGKP